MLRNIKNLLEDQKTPTGRAVLFFRKRTPRLFMAGRNAFVWVLRITKKDVDYFYDEDFAKGECRDKSFAKDMAEVIISVFKPASVIDFGCGTGDILQHFKRPGIRIQGIDASKANKRHAKIKEFAVHDLRKPYQLKERFDLCMCLEVAEHIPEKHSDSLLDNLTAASDTILFTAALPGQEGSDHCNLKPHSWWIGKFKDRSYRLDKRKTARLKADFSSIDGMSEFYVDNLMVFEHER